MDTVVAGLLVVIVVCILLYFLIDRFMPKPKPGLKSTARPDLEVTWLVPPDDDDFRDNERLIKDDSFVRRVAGVIELKTGCQVVPDKDLIRVYKNNKMVGIVKCCDGRKASPALVGEVVDLAQHLKVKTIYLATQGPATEQTKTFARLQKVKLISL